MSTPRWFSDTESGHSQRYVDRFRAMAADGDDLDGEARLVDAMLPRGARVLDAGCGPGRLAGALHARGHDVVGVDVDPVLIDAASTDHPGPQWHVADLSTLSLDGPPFDLAVLAGNVMVFVAPDTEVQVLQRVAAHVRPGGRIVAGFATDRDYRLVDFDRHVEQAGLILQQRFATWDLVPWTPDAPWAVSVLTR